MKRLSLLLVWLLFSLSACRDRSGSQRIEISNKGSDTLLLVAQVWSDAYTKVNPHVSVAVSGGGSGTGIAAIINGTADVANVSRRMKEIELEAARKNGFDPVEFIVGYDAMAVFVHHSNPLSSITLQQLAGIYGEGGAINRWQDLGIDVPGCDSGEIVRSSRRSSSGTFDFFKETVLGSGSDYKLGSRDMNGSKDVVTLVSNTPCAIGYSGMAYPTSEVKVLCLAEDTDMPCVYPSSESAVDRTYPLHRPLMMYTPFEPRGAVRDYLDWILSNEGQCIIKARGYAPIEPQQCD